MNPKLTVEYGPGGVPFSDFDVMVYLDKLIKRINDGSMSAYPEKHKYSTENIFNAIRHAVATGRINVEDVVFEFKGEIITIDKNGHLSDWPRDFCEFNEKLIEALIVYRARNC